MMFSLKVLSWLSTLVLMLILSCITIPMLVQKQLGCHFIWTKIQTKASMPWQ